MHTAERCAVPIVDNLWLAALTKNEDDAGSRNLFNLIVNIDGLGHTDAVERRCETNVQQP